MAAGLARGPASDLGLKRLLQQTTRQLTPTIVDTTSARSARPVWLQVSALRHMRTPAFRIWLNVRKVSFVLQPQECSSYADASSRVRVETSNDMKVGMGDVLTGSLPYVPTHGETCRVVLFQPLPGLVQSRTKIHPLLGSNFERTLGVPKGNHHDSAWQSLVFAFQYVVFCGRSHRCIDEQSIVEAKATFGTGRRFTVGDMLQVSVHTHFQHRSGNSTSVRFRPKRPIQARNTHVGDRCARRRHTLCTRFTPHADLDACGTSGGHPANRATYDVCEDR